jgi:hypothetical protein
MPEKAGGLGPAGFVFCQIFARRFDLMAGLF